MSRSPGGIGPGVAHPAQRFPQEMSRSPGGIGPALPETGHQHLTGAGSHGQQFPAHPVQLPHVPPAEAAQEGAQGGGRLDHTPQDAGRTASTQHVGVVDAVAAGQGGGHQGHQLVSGVGPARGAAQIQIPVSQLWQTETPGQGGRKEKSGIGHQAGSSKAIWMRSGRLRGSI